MFDMVGCVDLDVREVAVETAGGAEETALCTSVSLHTDYLDSWHRHSFRIALLKNVEQEHSLHTSAGQTVQT